MDNEQIDTDLYGEIEDNVSQITTDLSSGEFFFRGPVEEAVGMCRETSKLLIVFICAPNEETSISMVRRFAESTAVRNFTRDRAIVIQIITGTNNYNNFVQFFPSPSPPSIVVISSTGQPIMAEKNPNVVEFLEKLLQKLQQAPSTPRSPNEQVEAAHAVFRQQQEQKLQEVSEAQINEQRRQELRESIARIKKNIEMQQNKQQQQQVTQAPAAVTQQYVGASHSSTSVASDSFQDELRKRELEERKKAAEEKKRLKKQLLQQIKQDRENVKIKETPPTSSSQITSDTILEAKSEQNTPVKPSVPKPTNPTPAVEPTPKENTPISTTKLMKKYTLRKEETKSEPQPVSEQKAPLQYKTASISFRNTTTGESTIHVFDATDELHKVRTWVNMNVPNGKAYRMLHPPLKPFTQEQYSKTLQELKLAPNAVIILEEYERLKQNTSSSPGIIHWLWSMITSFIFFWKPTTTTKSNSEIDTNVRITRTKEHDKKKPDSNVWDNGNSTQTLSKDD